MASGSLVGRGPEAGARVVEEGSEARGRERVGAGVAAAVAVGVVAARRKGVRRRSKGGSALGLRGKSPPGAAKVFPVVGEGGFERRAECAAGAGVGGGEARVKMARVGGGDGDGCWADVEGVVFRTENGGEGLMLGSFPLLLCSVRGVSFLSAS